MLKFTLYSKPNCPLCDKAKAALHEFRRECVFDLDVVDIESDVQLFEKYKHDIPVLLTNGAEAARHFIGVEKLRVLVRRLSDIRA
ncbi:MAG TPA: glutaredoxin family protein [Planctomycetota bacterium]|nr:glutaredoxin family protein [Planctomycetota bacterium]